MTRTLRQRGQERRRAAPAACKWSPPAPLFFFPFAQLEENAKETLGDDDDVCYADGQRQLRQKLSATQKEMTHILFLQTHLWGKNEKKKTQKDSGLRSQANRINSFYLRDKKPPPLAEIHVNYKPSLSQHSCQWQINVRPLRSLQPPPPNNTSSIDS